MGSNITKIITVWGLGTLFLRADGTIWKSQAVGHPVLYASGFSDISNYNVTTCSAFLAVKTDGTVWAYGDMTGTSYGAFGSLSGNISVLTQIPGLSGIKKADTTGRISLFLTTAGRVLSCGSTSITDSAASLTNYATGRVLTVANANVPTDIGLSGIIDIIAGFSSFFLKNDGTVLTCGWGNTQPERGGIGSTAIPQQMPITGVAKIRYVADTALFIKSDNSLWGCGQNYDDILAYLSGAQTTTIRRVAPSLSNIVDVIPHGLWTPTALRKGAVILTTSGQLLSIVTGNESGTPLPISGPDGTPAFSSVDGIVSSNGGSNTYILPYNGGGSFVAIGGQNKDYGNYIQFSGSTGFSSADVDLLSAPPLRLFHLDSPPAAPVTPTITIGQNSINGVNVTFQGSGNGSSPIDGFYYSADGTDIDRSIIGPYHSGDTADQALNHPTVKFLPVGSGNSAQLTDIPNGVTIKMASRIIGAALSPMVSQLVRVACQPISCPVTQFAFLEFPDITLECPTVGSTILYSINEIDPDSPPAYIYEGSFKPIKRNLYLRAVARKTGYGDSPLFSRNFILALPTPIVVTRDKGEWLICEVFMSGNIECKFFYTLDGSQPKPFQSDFQEREFLLKSDTIVSAIGYREGCIPTNVTQLTIPISSPRKMKMKFMKDILF